MNILEEELWVGWAGAQAGFWKVNGGEVVWAGGFRWWGWGLVQLNRDVGQNFFPLHPVLEQRVNTHTQHIPTGPGSADCPSASLLLETMKSYPMPFSRRRIWVLIPVEKWVINSWTKKLECVCVCGFSLFGIVILMFANEQKEWTVRELSCSHPHGRKELS